jgi:hypothetical protein
MNETNYSSRWNRNLTLIALGLLLLVAASFFGWYQARREEQLNKLREEISKSTEVEAIVRRNCQKARDDFFVHRTIEPEQFIDAMQVYVLVPWRELEAAQRKLRDLQRSPRALQLFDRRLEAMKLHEQAWALMVDSVKQDSKEGMENAIRKDAEAARIEDELRVELKADREADNPHQ